jgi:hypothetical protein
MAPSGVDQAATEEVDERRYVNRGKRLLVVCGFDKGRYGSREDIRPELRRARQERMHRHGDDWGPPQSVSPSHAHPMPVAAPCGLEPVSEKRNRSLDSSRSKFRILKNHRAETRSEFRRLRWEVPGFPCQRPGPWPVTSGNVDTSASTRNSRRETPCGWLTTQSVPNRSGRSNSRYLGK